MELEASTIALRDPELRMYRIASYVLMLDVGLGLLTLFYTGPRVLGVSAIDFADVAYVVAFSIFLLGMLHSLTSRHQLRYLARRRKWFRRTHAEKIWAVCVTVLGYLALLLVSLFTLVFVELEQTPGQDLKTNLVRAVPFWTIIMAIFSVATQLWPSREPREQRA